MRDYTGDSYRGWLCACSYLSVHVHTCIHTGIQAYRHTDIHTYIHTYLQSCVYIRARLLPEPGACVEFFGTLWPQRSQGYKGLEGMGLVFKDGRAAGLTNLSERLHADGTLWSSRFPRHAALQRHCSNPVFPARAPARGPAVAYAEASHGSGSMQSFYGWALPTPTICHNSYTRSLPKRFAIES